MVGRLLPDTQRRLEVEPIDQFERRLRVGVVEDEGGRLGGPYHPCEFADRSPETQLCVRSATFLSGNHRLDRGGTVEQQRRGACPATPLVQRAREGVGSFVEFGIGGRPARLGEQRDPRRSASQPGRTLVDHAYTRHCSEWDIPLRAKRSRIAAVARAATPLPLAPPVPTRFHTPS